MYAPQSQFQISAQYSRARNDHGSVGGYAALATVLVVIFSSLAIIGGLTFFSLQEAGVNRVFVKSIEARAVADAGVEDALWRIMAGKQIGASETLGAGKGTTTVTVTTVGTTRTIRSAGRRDSLRQNVEVALTTTTTGVAFNFGAQAGDGGLAMSSGAKVNGNVYATGDVNGGTVTGTATVANSAGGATTKIANATIGVAGHANLFVNDVIGGSACPNPNCVVENPARQDMPITDQMIQGWKDQGACSSGCTLIAGNHNVSGSENLGPAKITGNLTFSNGARLTVTGTIWVAGDIDFANNCAVSLASGYGSKGGMIVVDGTVSVANGCTFSGSGSTGSLIMLLDDKNAPASRVIDVSNNSAAVIYYAQNGRVHFNNNAAAKEVTAYGLDLDNNATITYDSGLASIYFSSGPSGGYQMQYWKQVP